jgi:hypothetical protein
MGVPSAREMVGWVVRAMVDPPDTMRLVFSGLLRRP